MRHKQYTKTHDYFQFNHPLSLRGIARFNFKRRQILGDIEV